MSKIISVANPKGGVGKTTTAINLAAAFTLSGSRVLLVDIDPSGAASSGVGFSRENIRKGIYDLFNLEQGLDPEDISDAIHQTEFPNLDIIPCNVWSSEEENKLMQAASRLTRLKIIINLIKSNYDFIIIDCPPFLSNLTLAAFVASSSTLIPVQCGYFALTALGRLMKFYRNVRDTVNPYMEIEGIVLTMYEKGTFVGKKTERDAKMVFQELVLNTTIPKNTIIGKAAFFKKPVVFYDDQSSGSVAYKTLADELLKRNSGN